MRKKKKPSFSPVKVLAILLIVFVLLDVALRYLLPSKQTEFNVNRPVEYQELFIPNRIGQLKPDLDETVAFSNTTFQVKTNNLGLRSPETKVEKPSSVKQVVVLGDSVSFGWLMEEADSYPAILREKLREDSSNHEVINFSAPGLSSYYGKYIYDALVKEIQPDILILSYGLYDSKQVDIPDSVYLGIVEKYGFFAQSIIKNTISRFSSIGNWWFSRSQNEMIQFLTDPRSVSQSISDSKKVRVELEQAKEAITHIITQQQSNGGETILLDANIQNHYLMHLMDELHQTAQTKFFTIYDILTQSGGDEGRKLRYQKQLAYPGNTKQDSENISLLFRVFAPNQSKIFLRLQTVENSENQWFDLNDEGKDGDEKAGDSVWSVAVQRDKLANLFFTFYDKKTEDGNLPLAGESNVWLLNDDEQSPGFLTTMPLVIYGKSPHQEFRMPENPEYPGKELHRSIANRLYYLITEGKQ